MRYNQKIPALKFLQRFMGKPARFADAAFGCVNKRLRAWKCAECVFFDEKTTQTPFFKATRQPGMPIIHLKNRHNCCPQQN